MSAREKETGWLDGVRGAAALIVFHSHLIIELGNGVWEEAPFGAIGTANGRQYGPFYDPFRLPILRVFFVGGAFSVIVFFLLSGFVLSYNLFQKASLGQVDAVATSLGSALFRRWLRLYLPCFLMTLLQAISHSFGWTKITAEGQRKDTLSAQIWDWLQESEKFANPFNVRSRGNTGNAYEGRLWTIPREWAGSLMVYGTCLALAPVTAASKRSLAIGAVTFYAAAKGDWTLWMFGTGILISNWIGQTSVLKQDMLPRARLWYSLFVLGLLVGDTPPVMTGAIAYNRPGYEWLDRFVPSVFQQDEPQRFWQGIGGALFLVSACHLPQVRRIFSARPLRYLGKISYALYFSHTYILNLVGYPLRDKLYLLAFRMTYQESLSVSHSGWREICVDAVYIMVMYPLCLAMAHTCEIIIDRPATQLPKWLYMKLAGTRQTSQETANSVVRLALD